MHRPPPRPSLFAIPWPSSRRVTIKMAPMHGEKMPERKKEEAITMAFAQSIRSPECGAEQLKRAHNYCRFLSLTHFHGAHLMRCVRLHNSTTEIRISRGTKEERGTRWLPFSSRARGPPHSRTRPTLARTYSHAGRSAFVFHISLPRSPALLLAHSSLTISAAF